MRNRRLYGLVHGKEAQLSGKSVLSAMEVGIGMVTAFVGRDQNKSVEENLEDFGRIWPPIIQYTEEHGVRIAIENCPMLFGREQWPRSLRMWESWHIRWNIWNPSFRDWEMWTGDVMCLR